MSLDISFYSHDRQEIENIEVTDWFYEWLSHSEFPRIGKTEPIELKLDGEVMSVDVIRLEGENRRKFSDFLRNEIVWESDTMLEALGYSPSKEEYTSASSKLRTLQILRRAVEDERFKYLGSLG